MSSSSPMALSAKGPMSRSRRAEEEANVRVPRFPVDAVDLTGVWGRREFASLLGNEETVYFLFIDVIRGFSRLGAKGSSRKASKIMGFRTLGAVAWPLRIPSTG